MAAKTSAKLGVKRKSSLEPTIKNARALRYDDLSSVLLKLDQQTHGPANSQCDGGAGEHPTQLAALHTEIVSLKAENERMVERLTHELEHFPSALNRRDSQPLSRKRIWGN